MDIFFWRGGGHHEIGLYLGVIFMHFRVFSLRQGFLGVAKISNIFEVLEIPDISWGCMVDAGPDPSYEEKKSYPPLPSPLGHAKTLL